LRMGSCRRVGKRPLYSSGCLGLSCPSLSGHPERFARPCDPELHPTEEYSRLGRTNWSSACFSDVRPAPACHILPPWHAVKLLLRKGFPGRVPPCHTPPGVTEAGTPSGRPPPVSQC
jgi:hypothetical protein